MQCREAILVCSVAQVASRVIVYFEYRSLRNICANRGKRGNGFKRVWSKGKDLMVLKGNILQAKEGTHGIFTLLSLKCGLHQEPRCSLPVILSYMAAEVSRTRSDF